MKEGLIEVAVFAPLRGSFYYRPPVSLGSEKVRPGQMVRVPFGRSSRMGVVTAVDADLRQYEGELKAITDLCELEPIFDVHGLALGNWAATYYHHPLGEVLAAMLPSLIRQRGKRISHDQVFWHLIDNEVEHKVAQRARRQRGIAAIHRAGRRERGKFRRASI